ncbi:MAG: MAPEG family protein [Gammaproteobacteria bacterium]|nr:MAG: MAPEG family protein [Gammaproteobacteria bacterium]RLA24364.1 MAG: MAPEG family protein [Gammaproteobacteria bacterium]
MNPTLFALAGFAGWTLLLTFTLLNMRGYYAFLSKDKIALNDFSPDGKDVQGFGQRLTRAHLNCLEMLPSFAALVLVAGLTEQLAIMDATAMYILYARITQSTVHMISTSLAAVLLRATCWVIQLVLLLSYAYQLLTTVTA